VVLGAAGRRGEAKFRRCVAWVRPGRAREWSRGPYGPVCGLNGGKEWPVEGEHRGPAAPSAAAGIAGDRDLRLWLLGGGELRCSLEEGAGWWSGDRKG
jgi:hypothetical protein